VHSDNPRARRSGCLSVSRFTLRDFAADLPEAATLSQRLAALCERWGLGGQTAVRLERLLDFLANDPQAPTAVRDPQRAVDVHVADSLSGLQVGSLREHTCVVDIGSGAGFPGLVLALALPEARFDLVEATARKCAFLERVVSGVDIANARVVCLRAEEWASREGSCAYSGAVVRAVGSLPTLLEYAAPLLSRGGRLVAWKGRRDPEEELEATAAAELLGMRLVTVEWVGAYAGSRNRHIHTYEKVAACPPGFPRRPGMARKRPLGR
jgi:16S rRNA (guanine527-N7)-methyltransferase